MRTEGWWWSCRGHVIVEDSELMAAIKLEERKKKLTLWYHV